MSRTEYAGVARHLEHTKEIDEERTKEKWFEEPGSWKNFIALREGKIVG